MNDQEFEKSLISAYCDGELTVADQARAEALLATSPEARAELQSYRRLSSLLQETRNFEVQANLTASVMQTIGQSDLAASSTGKVRPNSHGNSKFTKKLWAAMAASAACVAAIVWFGVNGAGNQHQIADDKNNHSDQSTVTKPGDTKPDAGQTANTLIAENKSNSRSPVVSTETVVTPDKTPVKPLEAAQLPVELIADLKNSNVGQIKRFIRQNQDGVTVFHLMVVDVKPGMDSLEMMLSAQQISGVDGKPVSDRTDVVAVYVEMDETKMEGLVQQIKTDHEKFLALGVQETAMSDEQIATLKASSAAGEQAIAVNSNGLKTVGVAPLQPQQIELARSQQGSRSGFRLPPKALANKGQIPGVNGVQSDSPMYKLLILIEKATAESFKSQQN